MRDGYLDQATFISFGNDGIQSVLILSGGHAHAVIKVGVEGQAELAVTVRARIRVAPLEQWSVRREYLLPSKRSFDFHGVEIPFPQFAVHTATSRA